MLPCLLNAQVFDKLCIFIHQSFTSPVFVSMSCMAFFLLAAALMNVVDANAFLKANSHLKEERMSEEDVQTSLLAEVEGAFGTGAASGRVKQLEAVLAPIYAALPKNEKGYLGPSLLCSVMDRS